MNWSASSTGWALKLRQTPIRTIWPKQLNCPVFFLFRAFSIRLSPLYKQAKHFTR
jgi:hypothetical protein